MQVSRQHPPRGRAIAEAAFDALAADLTVPHPRPLVDMERDDYADLEVGEPLTVPFVRAEATQRTARRPQRPALAWRVRLVAGVVTVLVGFGLGVGGALLLI